MINESKEIMNKNYEINEIIKVINGIDEMNRMD